ncbi:Ig-like domain-containing protein [Paucibacter sp. M5-1]|uniref:Ig-like domain-containing protein n=1 Tax=Paucibacter sp. M5-1 TaxID=3015998 RepID=UPI003F7D507A
MTRRLPEFSVRIGLFAALLSALLAGCGGSGLDPILGSPQAGVAPTVTATSPANSTPPVSGVFTNTLVTATFSKTMAPVSLTSSSFSVSCPGSAAAVASTVSYNAASQVATLTPTSPLPASTTCVATITTAAMDSAGFSLAANYSWSFITAAGADLVRPTVAITVPAAGAINVASNARLSATFSEDINPATISATSFTLVNTSLGTTVSGSVSYTAASRTALFTPAAALSGNTVYTATIATAVTDLIGNAMAANYVWTFTTAALADTTRPTVLLTVPLPNAIGVPNNSKMTAVFSEDMNAETISATSFTVTNTTLSTPVAGSVVYSAAARTATFTPSATTLASSSSFTATITTAAMDLAGNALAGNSAVVPNAGSHVWSFSTAAVGDSMPPTITATSPVDGSTGNCLAKLVSATFSEAMDPTTINGTTVTVTDGGVAVAGIVSYDAASQVASFVPMAAAGFAANRSFVVTIVGGSTGVKDLAGNALATNLIFGFSTGSQPCSASVNLGTAALFGSFGGAAGITNQGINSLVGGNMGTTAACSLITGFHDASNVYTETPLNVGAVNGGIFCAPPAPGTAASLSIAQQALADAQAAYNTLAALPAGSDPGAGQLGGLTLASGVYTAAGGTFGITSGDLTLDAQGDANAVWVFQSAAALTVGLPATPRRVLLINGAQAKNVFWQVGSAARIEDRSTMVGTIIAPAGVTISTAGQTAQTTLTGRAIGLTASVTIVNTTIVTP